MRKALLGFHIKTGENSLGQRMAWIVQDDYPEEPAEIGIMLESIPMLVRWLREAKRETREAALADED